MPNSNPENETTGNRYDTFAAISSVSLKVFDTGNEFQADFGGAFHKISSKILKVEMQKIKNVEN